MQIEWMEKAPVYGDLIRTKVRFYYHYGIFVSESQVVQFGLPDDPMRPAADVKVLVSDVYTFLQGGDLEVAVPDRKTAKQMRKPAEITLSSLNDARVSLIS